MIGKVELISRIAKSTGLAGSVVDSVINGLIDEITNDLVSGNEVNLKGFASFKIIEAKARMGRNPKTGAPIKIPAKKIIKSKPSSAIIKAVNK